MANEKKKPGKRYRDAVTGRFVKQDYAETNPATTISEKVKRLVRKLVEKVI